MSTSGIILRTNSVFTDSSLPTYQNDGVFPTGNGALFLADVRTLSSAVPTAGQAITNLATSKAAALGISGDTSGKWVQLGTPVASGYALLERSGKGGIHVIASQATSYTGYQGFRLQIPMNIMDYIIANRNNTFYISQWRNLTRQAVNTTGAPCLMGIETGNTSGWGRMTTSNSQLKPGGGQLSGRTVSPGYNTLGPNFESAAGSIPTTDTLSSSNFNNDNTASRDVAEFGRVGNQNTFPPSSNLPSMIFYRGYIEDLTVSGRSFTTVNAIDKAMYDAAFASGGRFYNDTYTAVSTLP